MQETQQHHRTRSAGTKLSHEQYAALKARADEQGLGVSEYMREVLFPASPHTPYVHRLEVLCQVQLEETMALRSMFANIASIQAAGEPLTTERVHAIRAHADANKAARARVLLDEATQEQAPVADLDNKNKEVV